VQFLIILPDAATGLAAVEKRITPEFLASHAQLAGRELMLFLPKFKLEPTATPLGSKLRSLGMKTAFDIPAGTANFERMAPRTREDYLRLSEVFHKTWLALDEQGIEAAAATAVMTFAGGPVEKVKPVEVKVDRPFLFAVQHVPTGTCLFLGRVTDPR